MGDRLGIPGAVSFFSPAAGYVLRHARTSTGAGPTYSDRSQPCMLAGPIPTSIGPGSERGAGPAVPCHTRGLPARSKAYLPGSGDTMIHKVVLPGRDPCIALSLG